MIALLSDGHCELHTPTEKGGAYWCDIRENGFMVYLGGAKVGRAVAFDAARTIMLHEVGDGVDHGTVQAFNLEVMPADWIKTGGFCIPQTEVQRWLTARDVAATLDGRS